MKDPNLLLIVLVQVAVIIVVSRLMGLLFAKMRQPQVIGEMLAGILLGKTFFGKFLPGLSAAIFPADSMPALNLLAQLGVVVFLFLVGVEFDRGLLRKQGGTALGISLAGIAVPFSLGVGLAYLIRGKFDAAHQTNFLPSALFMGAAASVTAFPVLARILTERNLLRTKVGALSISAAAVDDVLAWTLLAIVVAMVPTGTGGKNPALILAEAAVYLTVMFVIVRPLLRRFESLQQRHGKINREVLAVLLLVMIGSVYATEHIGVHALFGAFVAGFVMPKGMKFVEEVRFKLEDFTLVFFLPLFFAFAGLKADLTRVFAPDLIGYTVLIIFIACVGKAGGVFVTAKLLGNSARESAAVGLLMNTRGLMELIILTVGLQLGVINAEIYGMMVVMALVTTAMTAPLLQLVYPSGIPGPLESARALADRIFSILIPVARPESGVPLVEIASYIAGGDPKHSRIQALHLQRPTDYATTRDFSAALAPAQAAVLEPLIKESKKLAVSVEPIGYYSRDAASDVARVARLHLADLVLIGHHAPVFGRALLGGTVHRIMTSTDADVAVFIDRGITKPKRVLVPFMGSSHDRLALDLAGRIARATGAEITLLHIRRPGARAASGPDLSRTFDDPAVAARVTVKTVEDPSPSFAVLSRVADHELVIIGVSDEWGLESSLLGLRAERIASNCPVSLLIVRRFQAVAEVRPTAAAPATLKVLPQAAAAD